jgi:hypothetical protein
VKAGPYRASADREVLLAETVEEIAGNEQQLWRSIQEKPGVKQAPGAP